MTESRSIARRVLAAAAVACGLWIACGGDDEASTTGASMDAPSPQSAQAEEAPDTAPVVERVRLRPSQPRPGERVTAEADVAGPGGRGLAFEYAWFVDGRRSDASGPSLHVEGDAGKGSRIEVSVVAVRGELRSEPVRASTRIGNLPPVLHGVVIEPLGQVTAGHDVAADAKATDPDGDALHFEYRWDVNGSTVSREGSVLPASFFKRGDEITVTVTANDGESDSNQIRSAPIPVVNSNPRIVSKPGSFDELGRFIYPVQVEDPDGDTSFRYRLLEAPEGMEIDIVDGTVRWTPTEDQAGRHPVKVEVADAHGGKATQSFIMSLNFADPTSESTPPASAEGSE